MIKLNTYCLIFFSHDFAIELNFPDYKNDTLVTASHAIFSHKAQPENKMHKAPVAVVGFQFRHMSLHALFKNITSSVSRVSRKLYHSWSFVYCVIILCLFLLPHVYCFTVCVCIAVLHTLVAGLLARSQYLEGPATGHLGTRFSWFPCV